MKHSGWHSRSYWWKFSGTLHPPAAGPARPPARLCRAPRSQALVQTWGSSGCNPRIVPGSGARPAGVGAWGAQDKAGSRMCRTFTQHRHSGSLWPCPLVLRDARLCQVSGRQVGPRTLRRPPWDPFPAPGPGRTASRGRSPLEAESTRPKSPCGGGSGAREGGLRPLLVLGSRCWMQARAGPSGDARPSALQEFLGPEFPRAPNLSWILGRSGTHWRGPAASLLPARPASSPSA